MKIIKQSLVEAIIWHAHKNPKRIAFIADDATVSYRAVLSFLSSTIRRLKEQDIRHKDRVLICSSNSAAMAIAYFAVHAVGAINVIINSDMPEDAVRFVVDDCGARLALLGNKTMLLPTNTEKLLDFVQPDGRDTKIKIECDLNDVADVLYTSGTTGRKKGVVLSHANIVSAAVNTNAFIQNTESDVEVVPIPLSHSFGLGRLRCMALRGNTLVLEQGMKNPAYVLKRLLDLKATGLALVPAGFDLILRMTGNRLGDASSNLRYIEIGSAPIRARTKEWLINILPKTKIYHHYGLTEASRAIFTDYHSDVDKPGTIGKSSPNVKIRICNEKGQVLNSGQTGEIVVLGDMVMREYWNQSELTSQVLTEVGLHTGDLGYMDPDGYIYLTGRIKNIINIGGLKVAPEEIEMNIDGFEGVKESACLGISDPDSITGECIKVYYVSDREIAIENLISWMRNRLEEYKIPRVYERVDYIPKTLSGKIHRDILQTKEIGHGS